MSTCEIFIALGFKIFRVLKVHSLGIVFGFVNDSFSDGPMKYLGRAILHR